MTFIEFPMLSYVIGQAHLETALSAYLFEYLVATAIARNGENMTAPCQPLVFLYDTFGNVQKTDVRFGVGFLSSGDYPQIAVEECLQAVRFFTSEYAKPVNTEKTNKSRTSSWVAFFMGASMSVCISVWVR